MSEKLNITSDKAQNDKIKSDLMSLYEREYCDGNKCKCYNDCCNASKALAKDKKFEEAFHSDYAARVGKNYPLIVNGKEISIVIVGKETLYGDHHLRPPARLIHFTNAKGKVNNHYLCTYKLLCQLMNYNWDEDKKTLKDSEAGSPYHADAVLTTYTLTNLYRCAFKEDKDETKTLDNPSEQTKNCLKILKKELDILKPSILIIQCAELTTEILYPEENPVYIQKKEDNGICDFVKLNNKNLYIIRAVHPSYIKGWDDFTKNYLPKIIKHLRVENELPKGGKEDIMEKLNELDAKTISFEEYEKTIINHYGEISQIMIGKVIKKKNYIIKCIENALKNKFSLFNPADYKQNEELHDDAILVQTVQSKPKKSENIESYRLYRKKWYVEGKFYFYVEVYFDNDINPLKAYFQQTVKSYGRENTEIMKDALKKHGVIIKNESGCYFVLECDKFDNDDLDSPGWEKDLIEKAVDILPKYINEMDEKFLKYSTETE